MTLAWTEVLIRLSLAALFGGLIGLERERKNWVAGLRTHMMVSVGSCLAMIVSMYGFADVLGNEHLRLDPARVAAQVISGIGFIGAGTILFLRQGAVRGLTTAAGLWTVAAIGLATGGGLYFAAAVTTVIALIILLALQPLERIYSKRFSKQTLKVVVRKDSDVKELLKELMTQSDIKMDSFSMEKEDDLIVVNIQFEEHRCELLAGTIDRIKNNPIVKEVICSRN